MVMGPCFDEHGRKKGAWSEDEDNKLRAYIESYGHYNWRELPKRAGLARCGKSCRLRWKNYLSPNVKLGNFSKEEEDVIVGLQNKLGNRWSRIAERLPGRSDNEIKNHWHAHLKTRAQRDQTVSKDEQSGRSKTEKTKVKKVVTLPPIPSSDQLPSISVTSSSSLGDDSRYATSSHAALQCSDYKLERDFWTEPFLLDDYSIYDPSDTLLSSPFGLVNDFFFEDFWQDITVNDSTFY